MFLLYADVVRLFTELNESALVGLCTGVSEGFFLVIEGKVEVCFRPTTTPHPLKLDWDWPMSE
jgi:hypothetical protein